MYLIIRTDEITETIASLSITGSYNFNIRFQEKVLILNKFTFRNSAALIFLLFSFAAAVSST